jgi:hypothetical protein
MIEHSLSLIGSKRISKTNRTLGGKSLIAKDGEIATDGEIASVADNRGTDELQLERNARK